MNSFMKGMTTGVLLSSVAGMAVATMMPKSKKTTRSMKHNAEKALKAMGGFIDNVQSILD
ncbi:MAG: hypothetical protein IJC88_05285 [Oscillospiraceae bacterium]|nr:hypothetical protein [Oscillospiraceae bacterium]